MYIPKPNAKSAVKPPNAADTAKAGMYEGASCARKILDLEQVSVEAAAREATHQMRPEELAIPTMTPVKTTLYTVDQHSSMPGDSGLTLFSEILLLEYHVDNITLGVFEPIHSRKHALSGQHLGAVDFTHKYATPVFCKTLIVPSIMNPLRLISDCKDHSNKVPTYHGDKKRYNDMKRSFTPVVGALGEADKKDGANDILRGFVSHDHGDSTETLTGATV